MDERQEYIIDFSGLEIFIDTTSNLDFQFISSEKNQGLFKKDLSFKNKDYKTEHSYWIRLKVLKSSEKEWLAEFYDQTIDKITAFIPQQNGAFKTIEFGDTFPYQKRALMHKNFHVFIPEMDGIQTIYFKVESSKFADIRIAVRSVERFVHYSLNEYLLYGIFYGMILIICLYNLLIYFAIKEIKYIYYIYYLLAVAVYAMSVDGIAFQYLWPNHPAWNEYASAIILYLVIVGAILFSRKFLRTKIKLPFHDKVLLSFLALRTIYLLITIVVGGSMLDIRYVDVLPLAFIFYTGIISFIKGYRAARFFVIAYGILFLGFIIKAFVYLNIIPFSIITYYSLHFSFLLEMLFLTFALTDRIRILKGNRDRAYQRIIGQMEENARLRDKVNQELEEKVNARTKQITEKNLLLEEANLKLQKQSQEINQINSLLDLDNWKLKNNLNEVLKDRAFPKKLSFEEFKEIFPNETSCFKYLHRLKWQSGYRCKKCGHEHHCDGHKAFSLRCTKCGYDESVTSHTIFQGVRFPINKAFFILYAIMTQDGKMTLDRLSAILELRRNTVWNFKKKVQNAIKSNHDAPEFSQMAWQNIMVDFGEKIKQKD